jgi:hypothetical protein
MSHELFDIARALSDTDLDAATKTLAAQGRHVTVQLVAHLAEVSRRGLALAAGYPTLFAYCLDALKLSEGEAHNRIVAATAAREFPVVLDMLRAGEINLTTVRELAKHLTPENHLEVLRSARGKRKSDVEKLVAALAPKPDAPTLVRRLPAPRVVERAPSPAGPTIDVSTASSLAAPPSLPASPAQPPTRPVVAALAPERFKYQTTVGSELLEKMQLARDLLSHAVPGRDEETVLARAFDALLRELARERFGETDRPGHARPTAPHSRHVPAAVKRAVFVRDLGRCAFTGPDGRRCADQRFLQFHHVTPYMAGGATTVENIQLRCRRHNQHEGRVFFAHAEHGRAHAGP